MSIDLIELLSKSDAMLIFAAMTFGLLIGRIKIRNIAVGSTTGILLVALVFGHFGFDVSHSTESLGFMLFIFCVGIEAGPNFFSSFFQDGMRYVSLAIVVALASVLVVFGFAQVFDLDNGLSSGVLAGALTSTPTLVGAQDTVNNRLIMDDASRKALLDQISVGYAISYLVGMTGLMILIQVLPKLLGIDMVEEAKKVASERGFNQRRRAIRTPILRVYEVDENAIADINGRTLREIGLQEKFGLYIEAVKRQSKYIDVNSEFIPEKGDVISIVGYPSNHARQNEIRLKREVFDPDLLDFRIDSEEIVVQKDFAKGKSLKELDLEAGYGCFAENITRSQYDMPLDRQLKLSNGDVLTVTGERNRLQNLADKIGFINERSEITDLVSFSAFFIFGIFLGYFTFRVGNFDIGLGSAGGLLFSGILMGYYRARVPTFGQVPQSAINIIKDLGLNFFMVSIGLAAGPTIYDAIQTHGFYLVIVALFTMIIPVLIAYSFGRIVLKMNPSLLLGAITGAMTSTPALNLLNESSKSSIPALGYAGSYAFANVFLAIAGAIIITIL